MGNTATNSIDIQAIKVELANSKKTDEWTDDDRKEIYDALFPNGTILNVASTLATAGSRVEGSGIPGINGGRYWIGIQSQVNPTTEAHISHFIHKALP